MLDEIFKSHLPASLFLDHYSLAHQFGHTPTEWRQYLKDNEHFITSETAAIAEAQARNALNTLGKGATSQEVSAIKALLEKSKLINDAQKQQQHVMLTYLPSKEERDQQYQQHLLQDQVKFLYEYIEYIKYLTQTKRFDPNMHTEHYFRQYRLKRDSQ